MRLAILTLWICSGTLGAEPIAPDTMLYTPLRTADSYTQVMAAVTDAAPLAVVQQGRSLFRQIWTIAGGEDTRFSGLGPLYNRFSCIACHPGNGRGFAPDQPEQSMKTMLVRLSVPDQHGGSVPHPRYGDQLNEFGVPGVAGEGVARLHYTTEVFRFDDGEEVTLRQPQLRFSELAYGELGSQLMTSARIAPAVFGLGLLDNVSDADILRLAQRPKPAGITGRPNYVWDVIKQQTVIGKFGWKANLPTLPQQVASAFAGDLGITSRLFPQAACMPAQPACLAAVADAPPELSDQQLAAIVFYLQALAVPAPAPFTAAKQRGAALFQRALCIECHTDQLHTGTAAGPAILHQRTIRPYTDLLLHDMGDALADHRPDCAANGREWRTAPLWGIGLATTVQARAGFLHDGRARTLQEAILWHGGEAAPAKTLFTQMSRQERALLIRFIESL